jgi:hypothetical protein
MKTWTNLAIMATLISSAAYADKKVDFIEHNTCEVRYLNLQSGDLFGDHGTDTTLEATQRAISLLEQKGYKFSHLDLTKKYLSSSDNQEALNMYLVAGTGGYRMQSSGRIADALDSVRYFVNNLTQELYYTIVAQNVSTTTKEIKEKTRRVSTNIGKEIDARESIQELDESIKELKTEIKLAKKELKSIENQNLASELEQQISLKEEALKKHRLERAVLKETLRTRAYGKEVLTEELTLTNSTSVLAKDSKTFRRKSKAEDFDFIMDFAERIPRCEVNPDMPRQIFINR